MQKCCGDRLTGVKPAMTFDEIGAEMGITRERVRQIFDRAMRKLRRHSSRRDVRELIAMIEARRSYAVASSASSSQDPVTSGRTHWTVN